MFVQMYHPALGNRQARVWLTSVDDWAARGWLLVDPGVTPPAPVTPYVTREEADSRYLERGDVLGADGRVQDAALPARLEEVALRAASVATAATLLATGERSDVAPVPATLTATLADNGFRNVAWMNADGTVLYAANSPTLRQSTDDGVTWTDVYNFGTGKAVHGLRDLDDGELLVSVLVAAANGPGELYRSSGYSQSDPAAATWSLVLTASGDANGNYFQGQWGLSAYRNFVAVSEYGANKTPPNNPRFAYLSTDYGKTFEQVYDMGTELTGHVHGVLVDPYETGNVRLWVSTGDKLAGLTPPSECAIRYSDDLGATWITVSLDFQPVGMIALPNCVLLVSDAAPNGVYRIPRNQNRNAPPRIEIAYRLDEATSLTWLGGQMFRARRDGAPVLMPFSWAATSGSGPGILLATVDGYNIFEVWRDTISYGSTFGLLNTVGPTASGKIVAAVKDGRQSSNSRLTATAPAWPGL